MKPDLQAICERVNKAETGPWILGGCSGRMITTPNGYVGDGFIADVDTLNNADFIANSRTDIPAILDYIEKLEEVVRGAREISFYHELSTGFWAIDEHSHETVDELLNAIDNLDSDNK